MGKLHKSCLVSWGGTFGIAVGTNLVDDSGYNVMDEITANKKWLDGNIIRKDWMGRKTIIIPQTITLLCDVNK